MAAPILHKHLGQSLWLSAERTVYWEEKKILMAADLHFGKSGHFRKSSIAIPQNIYKKDLQKLFKEIQHYQPKQVIIAGDMFHSTDNKEIDLFKKWRNDLPDIEVILVVGNHDILIQERYHSMDIQIIHDSLSIHPFIILHELPAIFSEDAFYIAGHIHPGVTIRGLGKQSLRFPCFYFSSNYLLLPAFSDFTGLYTIQPKQRDQIYAVLPSNLATNETASILKIQ